MCLSVISLCSSVIFVYIDAVYWFYGCSFFLCLNWMFQHDWTPTACVFYFCICTCSAQLNMFHTGKRSRNTLIITIIICEMSRVWLAGCLACQKL